MELLLTDNSGIEAHCFVLLLRHINTYRSCVVMEPLDCHSIPPTRPPKSWRLVRNLLWADENPVFRSIQEVTFVKKIVSEASCIITYKSRHYKAMNAPLRT